jgi:hypothetical protein
MYDIKNINYNKNISLRYINMATCYLCESKERESYWSHYCTSCRRIKHLLNLYGDRVNEVLEHVLVRAEDKQKYKINEKVKEDIEKKQYSLRSQTKKDKE